MTSRRRFLQLSGGLAAMGAVPQFAQAQGAAKFTAKVAHLESPLQPRHKGLEKVAALVSERTKGEVELKLYPAAQLGPARQEIEGVQFGAIECTVMPAAFLGGFNPVVSIFDIPFLYPDDLAKADALRTGPLGQFVLDSFASRGFVATTLWPNGRKCMTSNKPLAAPENFKGQKFRVMDSKILIDQFGAVGASAIALPFGELYTALQTGVVDGQENPPDTITTMKFNEVQKYLVVSNHGAMEDVVLFNPGFWNKLPEGHRKIVSAAFLEVRPEVEASKSKAMSDALARIKASGKTEVRELSAAERTVWQKQMAPAAEAAFKQRAGADGAKALDIYRTEVKRLGI
jgi:C4-dicarboxylate-binding protein DctP